VRRVDIVEFVGLAALWGASFLFMRMGAAEFGPAALAAVRVVGASLFLLPLLAWRGETPALRAHWKTIFIVGLTNSALPFLCFSYAALSISAGLSSIFNATTPLFGTVIAVLWLKDRLTPSRVVGLALGFGGVLWLVWDSAITPTADGTRTGWAVVACLLATVLYGFSASYTKKRLSGVPPMALAAGSQLAAAIVLAPLALWFWPAQMPGTTAWSAALLLAVLCTGVAYVLYFRLIEHIGPANALSVTFLIPAFAVLWGALFLDELVGAAVLIGCALILLGTALSTGLLRLPFSTRPSLLP
jgi:drug/metabolite transporter (DMT)-like permease